MDKKQKRTRIKGWISGICLALVTALLGTLPMLTAGQTEARKASILMDTVQSRDMTRVLLGGGPLSAVDAEDITIPAGVRITELLAANGDVVAEGDPIAKVDPVSVMTAVTQVQETLAQLQTQINAQSSKINVGVITVDAEGNIYSGGKKVETSKLSDYAAYLSLAAQYRDYTQMLVKLFQLNQSGTISASASGLVDGLDTILIAKTGFSGEAQLSLLGLNTPDGDDELTYTGFVGVVNTADETSWSMLMNPTPYVIDDFTEPGVDTSLMAMTMTGKHAAEPVLVRTEEAWEACETVKSGDILLFTYHDGEPAWILKLGEAENMPGNPGNPSNPGRPGGISGGIDWSQIQSAIGNRGNRGNSGSSSEDSKLYSTAETYICTVIPQEKMSVTIAIDEQDIARVQVGMTAQLTLDALPNRSFEAVVAEVSQFGSSNGGSSKFSVKLELDYETQMLPGMNAAAVLELETMHGIPTVPVSALVEQGNRTVIYTAYDPKEDTLLVPVPVETGLCDGEYVQILSGLIEGMPIWYSYYDTLEISNAVEVRGMFG